MTAARRRAILAPLLTLAALATTFYWWQRGRPVAVPNAPSNPIACVSYAPYHHPGQSPFNTDIIIPPSQIEQDLSQLAEHFNCVRTYSVGQGLAVVPQIAQRHGMKVLLGIWLGRDRAANTREMTLAVRTARTYSDAIRAIVVGNEVLLRGELPASELAADIERVRAATHLPVTYADVWEYWLKNPQLANAVSFVTIHILPYWEDHPVPIDDAIAHVQTVYAKVQKAFPGKTLLVGETGWPSAGRQRGGAVPSRINEAQFVRAFLRYANQSKVQYNLVEAYDQPWKRQLEGTAGGNWGLYDADGHPKFPLRGPVVEDPAWYAGPLTGIVFALLLGFAALLQRRHAGGWLLFGIALTGYIGGTVFVAEYRQLLSANRNLNEWFLTGSWALLECATIWFLAHAAGRGLQAVPTRAQPRNFVSGWFATAVRPTGINLPALIRFTWLFGAAIVNLLLVFDPRYRDFPLALFLPAAAGLAVWSLNPDSGLSRTTPETRILAGWTSISGIVIIVMEGISNHDAIIWAVLCTGLSMSIWLPALRACQHQHTHYQSDSAGLETIPYDAHGADQRGEPRKDS